MSSTLTSLESVYGTLTAEITAQMAALARNVDNADQIEDPSSVLQTELSEIEKSFEECSDVLEQMELEIRGFKDINERDKYVTRWQSYSAELRRLNQDFRSRKKSALNRNQRAALFDDAGGDGLNTENQKQTLLDNKESLERSGRKLNIGQSLLNETESIGASILNDLSSQRETISNARRKLRDTQDDLQASSKVLTKMLTRITANRFVMVIIAAVIFIVILLGIFFSVS